jgi:hypothetical protein
VILALACLLIGGLPTGVRAQGSGDIKGRVTNGTAGGSEIGAGVPITLYAFRGEAEFDSLETTTDAEGRFRFEGLDTDSELEYWLEAVYLDVPYSNPEPYRFADGQTELQATLTVYETTDDDVDIELDSVHMIIESFGQALRISEIHLFSNRGDRTYIGRAAESEQLTTVRIPLPGGAVGLAFQQDIPAARFVEVENGLLDTEPIPPGSETALVFFSYHLMANDDVIPLERRFSYRVKTISVLAAQPGLVLRSEQLQARGPELFQGQRYEFFSAQGVAAETPVLLELLPQPVAGESTGTPSASAEGEGPDAGGPAGGSQGLLLWFGLGLVALAALGAIIYPALSRRPSGPPQQRPRLPQSAEARELLVALADLEAALEAGQVDESTYARQRAEMYEALKSL